MKLSRTSLLIVTLTLAFVCALIRQALASDNYQFFARKIPVVKLAPDFTLTDQNGKPFSLKSLRGKLVLMSFGFTHCPNICPTTLAGLANSYKLLSPEEQKRVQVLFVSVDPERDTPNVLKDYVPFFDSHFIGLTGSPEQIATMSSAYGVQYEKDPAGNKNGPNEYNIDHTAGVYIIQRDGQWTGYYREGQLISSDRVADDLRHFLALSPSDATRWESEKVGVVKNPPPTGRQLYLEQCASCHLENGSGVAGKYPSLVKSPWVEGAPNRLTALLFDGVRGGHDKNGAAYAGVMPAYRTVLTPANAAAILTYIRQSWGNTATPIAASYVQNLFYQLPARSDFWSWKDLESLPAEKDAEAGKP